MTIKHQNASGGTYDSNLPICPLFTFTRVVPPGIEVLDLCDQAFPPVQVGTVDAPWGHNVQLPLVCPGVSTPNFRADGPHTGPHPDAVPLESLMPIPAMGPVGLTVFGGLLVTALVVVTRRRRARA